MSSSEDSAISLSNVQFSYGPHPVLNISDLKINSGEKVFIHGPSGSGKSTLLNLLAGVTVPNSGELSILNRQLHSMGNGERDKLRGDHIGFIFQSFNLIPYLTAWENILLPCKINKNRKPSSGTIDDQARNFCDHLKITEHLEKKVSHLSIGQQQRVAVARALMGNPEIIIADEPTSALDEDVTNEFMNLIIKEWEEFKFTLVFVSHDRRLASFFDRNIDLTEINQVEKK